MNVKLEHLTKHLESKLKKGNYGSVLIHYRDGVVTGVQDKTEHNPNSFVDYVENAIKPVKRYIVKNNKSETAEEDIKIDTIEEMIVPKESINAKKMQKNANVMPEEKQDDK